MPLKPNVAKLLAEKQQNQQLQDLRQKLYGLVDMSRSVMKDFYPRWDRNDQVYRGERGMDADDRAAVKRNEPSKVFVPLTQSQCQTFVAYTTMMLTSKDYFFELGGTGIEDIRPSKLAQAVLQRDLGHNKFTGVLLPQFLTDVARFGLGIFKTQWRRETVPVYKQIPDPDFVPDLNAPAPVAPPMVETYEEKTKYLGNMIEVMSPYRWFPDTRLPLTRYRDGEFCADEREYSFLELQKMEKQGLVSGVEDIPRLPDNNFRDRRTIYMNSTTQTNTNAAFNPLVAPKDAAAYCIVTEIEYRCNPSKLVIGKSGDKDIYLNPRCDHDIIILIWVANDSRIIRIEESGYNHNEFLYDAAQFFNDQNRVINYGIAELIGPMQDVLDWLMNSRVTNVRKVMNNMLVVDPRNVEMQDLKDRNPVLRLKSTVPEGMSIDAYVKQLNVVDVTTGHITDMPIVKNFSEDATGLSETLQGQPAEGRRSAREMGNVIANSSARAVLPVKGLWEMAIAPLGDKALQNLQQGLDVPQLVNIIGLQRFVLESQPSANPLETPAVQAFLPVDRTMLVGTYDFLLFDATLPSLRMAQAAMLAQAGDVLIKSPTAIFALGKDPKLLFEEWLELGGIRNAERFNLTPQRAAELLALAGVGGNKAAPGAPQRQGQNG